MGSYMNKTRHYAERLPVRFPVVSLEFFIHIILRATLYNIFCEVKAAHA